MLTGECSSGGVSQNTIKFTSVEPARRAVKGQNIHTGEKNRQYDPILKTGRFCSFSSEMMINETFSVHEKEDFWGIYSLFS